MLLPGLVTASVADQIMGVVRRAIMTGRLTPGELYSVEQVAELLELGVSRTPTREALVRLADDGLVRFERNRGIRIVKPDVHDLEELFQLRLMVEVPATYQTALRVDKLLVYKLERELDAMSRAVKASEADVDPESTNLDFVKHDRLFHELIIGAGGNQRLVQAVQSWRHIITVIGGWRVIQSHGIGTILRGHEDILTALRQQSPQAAAQAMFDHLTTTGTLLLEELQNVAGGTFDPTWYAGVAVPENSGLPLESPP